MPSLKATLALGFVAFSAPAMAAEIRLFGTGAVQHSVQEIVAAFEKETGHKVLATFGTAGAIGKRLADGEPRTSSSPRQADCATRGRGSPRANRWWWGACAWGSP